MSSRLDPQTPHGFVPMGVRGDNSPHYDMKTPMTATFKEEEAVREAEETVTKIDRKDLVSYPFVKVIQKVTNDFVTEGQATDTNCQDWSPHY